MLKRMSQRGKYLLILLMSVVVLGCFYFFYLTPQMQAYARVKSELSNEKQKLTKAQLTANSLKEENDKIKKAKNEVKSTGKKFAVQMTDGSDIIFLGIKSASQDIHIKYIEPGEIKENKYLLELPVKMTLQGNYLSLLEFIKSLDKHSENLINLAEIRSLKIESLKTDSSDFSHGSDYSEAPSNGMVTATLNLVIYSARMPDERLRLEQISQWMVGRYDIFRPAVMIAPIPEMAGHLHVSSEGTVTRDTTGHHAASGVQTGSAVKTAGPGGSGYAQPGIPAQSARANQPTRPVQQ